jgi:hypothetical protein
VATICPKPFAVVGVPYTDYLILRDGENKVTFAVISVENEESAPKLTFLWVSCATNLICVKARSWPANRIGLILADVVG